MVETPSQGTTMGRAIIDRLASVRRMKMVSFVVSLFTHLVRVQRGFNSWNDHVRTLARCYNNTMFPSS